jgi:hypothetical protein
MSNPVDPGTCIVHVFDTAGSQRGKKFYLLDESKRRLVSQPVPKGVDPAVAAIDFLSFVWDGEPPHVLVMDGELLTKRSRFLEFLKNLHVGLSIMHPAYAVNWGKIERAIWQEERREARRPMLEKFCS